MATAATMEAGQADAATTYFNYNNDYNDYNYTDDNYFPDDSPSSSNGNLPELPPPVLAEIDQDARSCRACKSTNLLMDWAQGDRVCTDCGVVAEGHILDDRPEWKEFNDVDDLAKGGPALARSGLVVVDESKYLGGLQPTTLSKQAFGGSTGNSSTTRKRLLAANRKMDKNMEKMHARALESAQMSVRGRKRLLEGGGDGNDDTGLDVRPEIEQMVLQEEEDAKRLKSSRYADKWSLDRAIRLYGHPEETPSASARIQNEDTDELRDKLDAKTKHASLELYRAYSMLTMLCRKLALPDRVTNEGISLLCKYAARRDGLIVRGVSSTLKKKSNKNGSVAATTREKEEEARIALRDYNSIKQAGALCAALIYYTSRKLGWPRSLVEVCESISPPAETSNNLHALQIDQFIKRKHCSKAMAEIKEIFPDIVRVSSGPLNVTENPSSLRSSHQIGEANIMNFTDHTIRKLQLPLVAEASVRSLAVFWQNNMIISMDSTTQHTKAATICAALTLFVCQAGELMQRLASQAEREKIRKTATIISKTSAISHKMKNNSKNACAGTREKAAGKEDDECRKFDVFNESSPVDNLSAEQRAYEMGRVWDAWKEQMPWARPVAEIEKSTGVSSTAFLDYYRKQIHPERLRLLTALKGAVERKASGDDALESMGSLRETPLSTVLLPHIVVVSKFLLEKPNH